MEEKIEQSYEVSFIELLLALKEKLLSIILVTIVSAFLGWLGTFFLIVPQYQATVNMIVNTKSDIPGYITTDNIYSAQNLVDTYAIIIKSNTVLNEVIEELDLQMSYEEIYEQVSVNAIDNTQVMKIAVKHHDVQEAKRIAEAISEIAPEIVVNAVEAGSCKVVSQVEAEEKPISPNIWMNTMITGVLGMIVCIAFVVLKELLHDYIVDDVDIEKKLGISALGIIPDMEEK